MANQSCSNCVYLHPGQGDAVHCRRYPQVLIGFIVKGGSPVTTGESELNIQSFFNHAMAVREGWCGEWKGKKK